MPRGRVVVVGLGNEHRGDDGAGKVALRRIRPRLPEGVEAWEAPADPAGLLEIWDGAERAYVIDATRSGSPPGVILRWEGADELGLPRFGTTSTHGLSLAEAIGLGVALGRRPGCWVVFGIEAGALGPATSLTEPVERAADEVVERILKELGSLRTADARREATHA
jgi:hydrogenase maturation protease